MKTLNLLFITHLVLFQVSFGQNAKFYFNQGNKKIQEGQIKEAIELFNKSIEISPNKPDTWINRGIAKDMLALHKEAILDYDQAIKLDSTIKQTFYNRAIAKKSLDDYPGALADYWAAIRIDSSYASAYNNLGLIYEILNKKDSACILFSKAYIFGYKYAKDKLKDCNDSIKSQIENYHAFKLAKTASNKLYGFTKENPVKVGSGPIAQEEYLELLRDAQDKPVKYQRLGSIFPTHRGARGMVDKYGITYQNEKGEEKKTIVYITFYEFEEPKVLFGFKTKK